MLFKRILNKFRLNEVEDPDRFLIKRRLERVCKALEKKKREESMLDGAQSSRHNYSSRRREEGGFGIGYRYMKGFEKDENTIKQYPRDSDYKMEKIMKRYEEIGKFRR